MSPVALAAGLLALLCAGFALARGFARRIDNYGIVDVCWTLAFVPVAVVGAVCERGWAPRRWLLAAMVCGWSLRLGLHILIRIRRHHPQEDTRYARLRQEWGAAFGARMTWFFQAQALSVVVLSLPFFLAFRNDAPRLGPNELIAALLFAVALAGEAAADRQLAAFQADPANRGQVCDRGLWRHSRHPNYFFEWLTWVAYALFALGAPAGWLGLIAPAGILYLLLRVTGIPMAEEQSLRSRGDAYRRYQARTSAFVPWFSKP